MTSDATETRPEPASIVMASRPGRIWRIAHFLFESVSVDQKSTYCPECGKVVLARREVPHRPFDLILSVVFFPYVFYLISRGPPLPRPWFCTQCGRMLEESPPRCMVYRVIWAVLTLAIAAAAALILARL
jgi:hypothetical protein